jgi:hypothetical protein
MKSMCVLEWFRTRLTMSYPTDEERKKKVETSERTRTGEERFGRRTEVILMKGLG